MNERIKELAFNAADGMLSYDEDGYKLSQKEVEKFAELIVEECAKLCEDLRPSKPEYDQRFYDGCTLSAYVIRNRMK